MSYKDPEKQREYQRLWIARRRAEYLADKTCVRCGSRDRLEVDHVDPSKKVDHRIWSWSKARRDVELAKCQVLCWDHHREKTGDDMGFYEHGTHVMYSHHGCRCEPCTTAHRESMREWRGSRD